MPVSSMSSRMSASACAYAAPLPRIMTVAVRSPADRGTFDRFRRGNLPRGWIDNARQRLHSCICIGRRRENFCGQNPDRPHQVVLITAARIRGVRSPIPISSGLLTRKRCFGVWFRRIQLIKFFRRSPCWRSTISTVARSTNLDHGKTVGRSIGDRNQAVQKTWCGDSQTNPRLLVR